ncbi:hypothetical protein K1719_028922 [Acacia pycnantha]|nr:hypothetical protein K1719_028922 [Acacia pycnantha]
MGLKREGKRPQQEEEEEEGGGFIIQKLRNGEAIRVSSSSSTPPPIWRIEASSFQHHGLNRDAFNEFLLDFPTTTISARKLCASLWQIQPHQTAPLRRRRRHDKLFQQPASATNLRRGVSVSFVQHHRSIEPNCYATQPIHSSKHCNLAEAAQCNCKVTPTSTLEAKGRIRESSCNHKTSRELLKVLNRIQRIREQHASNISVVKGLKAELDLSRAQIKELRREKQMKILMKQMAEDKFAVQSAEEELEDERRSRRHSEILHWRLSQELSEVKSLFYGSLRELDRERKARILLENLCDEFAIRTRDFQQESHSLKHKSEKKNDDVGADRDNHDRLILDISEAWLDERMQMKVEKAGDDLVEMINSVVDRLGFDIETFLRTRRSVNLRKYGNSSPKEIREIHPCHYNSLDSFPIKEPIIAPVNMHEDDTANAENFGSASGEGHGKTTSVDQEKEGRKISTGKQVKTSVKTALINEIEVSTVCEEPEQVAQESDHRS